MDKMYQAGVSGFSYLFLLRVIRMYRVKRKSREDVMNSTCPKAVISDRRPGSGGTLKAA